MKKYILHDLVMSYKKKTREGQMSSMTFRLNGRVWVFLEVTRFGDHRPPSPECGAWLWPQEETPAGEQTSNPNILGYSFLSSIILPFKSN